MQYIAIIATCLSIISIIISLSEKLQRAKIKIYIAEYSRLIVDGSGNLGFHFPVTFVNKTGRMGVIDKFKIKIESNSLKKQYYMEWESFCKTEGEKWERESQIYPIAIEGKKYFSKIITFLQYKNEQEKCKHLQNETYKITFEIYRPGDKEPHCSKPYYFEYTDSLAKEVGNAMFEALKIGKWIHINFFLKEAV
ncbi:MAG: hypothetical protein FIA99_19645 [Ruminiclostridium sp.]|nr:hypothetical protein [Ruminiclostridium sp.]